jgi:PAS domain S-box-containing protein
MASHLAIYSNESREIWITLAIALLIAISCIAIILALAMLTNNLRRLSDTPDSARTQRVELATDSARLGIWEWKMNEGNVIGDAWLHRLYGIEPSEDPKPLEFWTEKIHEDDRSRIAQTVLDAIENDEHYNTEFRVVWDDGSVHHLRVTGKVERDSSGRAVRMVGTNWDVTEARLRNAQHNAQHELLLVTLQSITEGVITKDANRNIVWMNAVAERLTGWSTSEVVGQPVTSVVNVVNEKTRLPVDVHVALFPVARKAVSSTEPALLIARDGSECIIETTASPLYGAMGDILGSVLGATGDVLGSVLVFRDVTEQRRLAAETERNAKLQLDLKLKDEFLSHVSHELRSPLTSIYSFASIIADNLAGETTQEQQQYLAVVLKNVTQLQSMIEDLLQVTQSREGKLSVELHSISAAEAIADSVNTVRGSAAAKQLNLSIGLQDGFGTGESLPSACADPVRLRQILIVLLDNAIKFTPVGGSVNVRVCKDDECRLLFQVTDSGCGVPMEHRARVFEKLYQVTGTAPSDTSHAGRVGLGLGLHIARDLVHRQGGTIWISGDATQGSTFNFTVPIAARDCETRDQTCGAPRRRSTDRPVVVVPNTSSGTSRAA